MTGRVYLVGAGPGDPGLLTLRGQRCLAAADVVVHDDLVGRRLLEHARSDAEVIAVGGAHGDPARLDHAGLEPPLSVVTHYLAAPRLLEHARSDAEVIAVGGAHGDPARLDQAEIERLLVARARAGKTVVRLKNGDPFLFGRGAEEAEALRRAAVPFEVVPGVSAALAVPAYAGIPATHRDHASLVTIATGHQARPAPDAEPTVPALPWSELARQGGTLVFLMGMRQLPLIMTKLMEHGLARDTPAAVVERGTTGRQRTVVATVATLAERVRGGGLGPPGVVVVGSVVRVREQVRWFEDRPLFGRRVVVTRARAQAGELARLLEEAGADVIVFPTIAIGPPRDPAALDRAVASAFQYDWIVFTSPNGVRVFFERFATQGRDVRELAGVRLAAIGPETAAELGRRHLRPDVVPAEYRAEGLVEALAGVDLRGRRFLLPRAAGARAVLPEALAARGALVEEVVAYEAVLPRDADVDGLRAALAAGAVDAIAFTSSSTVRNFVTLLGADEIGRLVRDGRPAIACIGPVTAETARAAGLVVAVEPAAYTAPALAAALVERLRVHG